ncbi:AP-4 complex accessory subunit RUSC1 isoform X1 [Elgaria multicarinata webbii]|uniref:AP-4 complex accessory subunit RUSC1 isoform X1 n=1 Tax=Elgaria multicarinata webbii TaxID=159646 RepID=UPI002FCD0E21
MQSPKKGLLCNLNHIHLQHVSLGLHLSRHPELREDANTLAPPREQTGCQDCGGGPELVVDANSNNPSLPCRCCDSHPLQSGVKEGLQTQTLLPNCPVLKQEEEEEEEEEEEAGSPSDPASLSVSSCSDLSLDDSPVSVYCKEFPAEEAQSPENQPNIVPLEDAHHVPSLADRKELGSNLNVRRGERPASRVWDSPDSLCSSSSLESASDSASPGTQSPDEAPLAGSCPAPQLPPPPVRPCRAPPAVPVLHVGPELDSNSNALVAQEAGPGSLSSSGQVDVNSNQAPPPRPKRASVPPPVPPRTKRGLQGLRRQEAGKPTPESAPPVPSRQDDAARKNITSFHELAQKRKKAVSMPPTLQTRKDQSDWLIVFSPDTELPPCHELTWGSAPGQETTRPPASSSEPANSTGCLQRGVTTFKELRCRKQKGQPATQPLQCAYSGKGRPEGDTLAENDPEPPAIGHFWAPKELQPRRKTPRPGLQPIVEGGFEEGEDGGAERKASGRSLQGTPNGRRDPWMPGREERGGRRFQEVRHSQSFNGVPSAGCPRRADADHVSAQLREQKKALLVAVSASVDKIVAHFSTARNLVQKAQLGDSRLSPDVGYLVLSTLCPALRALVSDGLKPFQKDVITGQRPSSPWSVVEASAKPGPHARSLNALYWRVSRLAPLRSNQQRFHAFILGLLNMKQLEQWFAQLQRNSELISALYFPTAFLVLSQGFCRRWSEELLLLLQPLSMLTFQLDLLFEHHHLPLDARPMASQAATPTEPPAGSRKAAEPSRPDFPRRQVPLAGQAEGPVAQSSPLHQPQEGVPLHQRLLQWGDRLTYTLRGREASLKPEPRAQAEKGEAEEKPRSWWEQLSQPAGAHTNASGQEGFSSTHWTKLRLALGEAVKEGHSGAGEAAANPDTCPQTPRPGESHAGAPKQAPSSGAPGSLPDGGAARQPETTPPSAGKSGPAGAQEADGTPDGGDTPGSRKGQRLGWLFGANCPGASNEPDLFGPKYRRPSSWLPPTMNVLALVMKTSPAEKSWQEESWEHNGPPDPLQAYRAVRALCDHAGSGTDHLSFRKGDILQVLDTVDEDWIQCCQGDRRGLVPVGYTSLIL